MNGNSGRMPGSRQALIALAVAAIAGPAPLAHAQEPPVYDIPPPPPGEQAPPPGSGSFGSSGPGQPAARPGLMRPFPTVRTAGRFNRRRTSFSRVAVSAPEGATVRARCTAARCTQRRAVGPSGRVRLRRLERAYKPKVVVELRVTAPGVIGKHVELRIRRGRPPLRRDRCLQPGSRTPRSCPSG